jgi:uncharacterized protein
VVSVYYAHFMKWLILLLLIWLVWRLLRARQPASPPAHNRTSGEVMRACAHCGLNVPESEALIESESLSYCSEAHRRLGPAQRGFK